MKAKMAAAEGDSTDHAVKLQDQISYLLNQIDKIQENMNLAADRQVDVLAAQKHMSREQK